MDAFDEKRLEAKLATPSERLIRDMAKVEGNILLLGAGGKMGPSLSMLAVNAMRAAGKNNRVFAASRFTDPYAVKLLRDGGVHTISCDLLDDAELQKLPDTPNVLYLAGRKFGTHGNEYLTWAMNAWLPVKVAERFKKSRIVVFSSGNVYPLVPASSRGATEATAPSPRGEYAMSCLARERMFEYASMTYGTPVLLYRLNYAVDLRYGVLYDIAEKISRREPVSLGMSYFNCIWQGDANEAALRCLLHTASPPNILNVTGSEKLNVRETAVAIGKILGIEPSFEGKESDTALLSDSSKAMALFGHPSVDASQLILWQAQWIKSGGRSLAKPTHFEERGGQY